MKTNETINQILQEYLNVIKMLFRFEQNDIIHNMCDSILKHILNCVGRKESYDECKNLIDKSNYIKTLGDAVVLDLEDSEQQNERFVLEQKAKILNDNKIKNLTSFDQDIFINDLIEASNNGNIDSCKLFAILNELGLLVDKNIDTAKLIYKMLSYTGDIYSLYYLININQKNKLESSFYKDIKELYLSHQTLFIPVLNKEIASKYNDNVKDYVEIILCNKNRIRIKKIDVAEIVFLYYLAITEDDINDKLSNICDIKTSGYELVLREKHFKNRKYGF